MLLDNIDEYEIIWKRVYNEEGFRVSLKFYYKFQHLKALFVKVVNSYFLTLNSCLFARCIL